VCGCMLSAGDVLYQPRIVDEWNFIVDTVDLTCTCVYMLNLLAVRRFQSNLMFVSKPF
jgi:hypothetical protein